MNDPPGQNPAYRPSPLIIGENVRRQRVLWAILLLFYAGAIFILSSFPLEAGEPLVPFPHGDKLLHFLEFFVFFVLSWKVMPTRRRLFSSLVLTAVYAGSDEFHQFFIVTRAASLLDWLADLAGGAAAAGLIVLLVRFPLPLSARVRILKRQDCDKEG